MDDLEIFVRNVYDVLLNRDPDPEGFQHWMTKLKNGLKKSDFVEAVMKSAEFYSRLKRLRIEDQYSIGDYKLNRSQMQLILYQGYSDSDIEILKKFRDPSAKAEKGFIVDTMGIRTRSSSLWKEAQALDGQLLDYPIPADYHAETIEWLGLTKSVMNAQDKFVAMELGAGIGTWIIAGAVLARLRGIKNIFLSAVEGNSHHFRCMLQHFKDNGFDPREHKLYEAAVGVKTGFSWWPVVSDSLNEWGSRPVAQNDTTKKPYEDYLGRKFDKWYKIKVVNVVDLLTEKPEWDLVHIDIQGDESNVCRAAMHDLSNKVKWVVIGTHSRKHDGDVLELFAGAGWILEHEKPCRFKYSRGHASLEAMTTHDGTQVWRNPKLTESDTKQR